MILAAAEARLKENVSSLRLVAGAAEYAALDGNPPKHQQPAAYVMPIQDSAGPNRLANGVRQENTIRFAVVLALGNLRDSRGGTATKEIEALRKAVIAALVGWEPADVTGQVLKATGRMIGLRDGVVWWQDDFTVTDHIRV